MKFAWAYQPLFSTSAGEFRFASPLWLLLLLAVPFVLAGALYLHKRRPAVLRFSSAALLKKAMAHTASSTIWRTLMWTLRGVALVALIVAMARPQFGRVERQAFSDGIDIMLSLDVSLSMRANDFFPSRLEAAKQVLAEFVGQRKGDRIGLVIFGKDAAALVPLTFDYPVLAQFIERINFSLVNGEQTAIGMGLMTALSKLEDSKAKSKVVILLTDGENNAGRVAPLVAAEAAKTLGIRVYTIGVGSDAPPSIFGPSEPGIDEEGLTQIAQMTGGLYFRATDEKKLAGIYDQIDNLEKTRVESTQFENFRELAPWLVMLALAALGSVAILKSTRWVEVP
ncbi:aerotolerance regulator BatA [candidate division BRC1 bacterium HGW-BRC1-1]|jgi:Ca-activated chloride channel family protein|nr:MAG: aerotolerance regulator BatA [candidate division BRC1 bacterium HGW-BRC1-1]